MDHYADDLAALTAHLDLKQAVHVGHSTGGGEVAHYLGGMAKAGWRRLTDQRGAAADAEDGEESRRPSKRSVRWIAGAACGNRSQFYRDLPEGPFYGFNRPGVKASEAIIQNWWRQGMMAARRRITTASSPSRRQISPKT